MRCSRGSLGRKKPACGVKEISPREVDGHRGANTVSNYMQKMFGFSLLGCIRPDTKGDKIKKKWGTGKQM